MSDVVQAGWQQEVWVPAWESNAMAAHTHTTTIVHISLDSQPQNISLYHRQQGVWVPAWESNAMAAYTPTTIVHTHTHTHYYSAHQLRFSASKY